MMDTLKIRVMIWILASFVAVVKLVLGFDEILTVPLDGKYPLIYHSFVSLIMSTKYQCMELCLAYALCRSLTYRYDGMCEMNSDDRQRQGFWISGYDGLVLSRADIPQVGGTCQYHNCAIDEMCVRGDTDYTCVKHGKSIVKCPVDAAHSANTCDKVFREKKTWLESKKYCNSVNSSMLEIHSFDDEDFYLTMIGFRLQTSDNRGPGFIWTGLRYSQAKSAWIWNGSGTVLSSASYHNFNHSLLTRQDDMCMGLPYINSTVFDNWAAQSCDEENMFVCHYVSPDVWP